MCVVVTVRVLGVMFAQGIVILGYPVPLYATLLFGLLCRSDG